MPVFNWGLLVIDTSRAAAWQAVTKVRERVLDAVEGDPEGLAVTVVRVGGKALGISLDAFNVAGNPMEPSDWIMEDVQQLAALARKLGCRVWGAAVVGGTATCHQVRAVSATGRLIWKEDWAGKLAAAIERKVDDPFVSADEAEAAEREELAKHGLHRVSRELGFDLGEVVDLDRGEPLQARAAFKVPLTARGLTGAKTRFAAWCRKPVQRKPQEQQPKRPTRPARVSRTLDLIFLRSGAAAAQVDDRTGKELSRWLKKQKVDPAGIACRVREIEGGLQLLALTSTDGVAAAFARAMSMRGHLLSGHLASVHKRRVNWLSIKQGGSYSHYRYAEDGEWSGGSGGSVASASKTPTAEDLEGAQADLEVDTSGRPLEFWVDHNARMRIEMRDATVKGLVEDIGAELEPLVDFDTPALLGPAGRVLQL